MGRGVIEEKYHRLETGSPFQTLGAAPKRQEVGTGRAPVSRGGSSRSDSDTCGFALRRVEAPLAGDLPSRPRLIQELTWDSH